MTPKPPDLRQRGIAFGILFAMGAYLAIVLPYLGYFPLWDTLFYLDDYLFKARDHLTVYDFFFTNSGHPCAGYYWILWLGQWLFPNSLLTVQLINIGFGLLAIVAFGQIAQHFFRNLTGRLEVALITLCFAVHPVFVAYSVNMLMEYGVLAYFLAVLWLLHARRLGWAAVAGILLVFSKETGVVLYVLPLLVFLSGSMGAWRWRNLVPLSLPFVAFAVYVAIRKYQGQPLSPWAVGWFGNATMLDVYLPNPFKGEFLMACFLSFILEFQWIFAALVVAALVFGLSRRGTGSWKDYRYWLAKLNLPFRCFLFILAGCLYCSSRTVSFANPRYVLTLYPLLLLCFLAALVQLGLTQKARTAILAASVFLLLLCNFRTLDPVSRAMAGTFPFGRHELLSLATMRPDIGSLNRDELVYNLEHTHMSFLLDRAMETIKPTKDTLFVVEGDSWWILSRLDPRTFHRTELLTPPCFHILMRGISGIGNADNMPPHFFLIELPYLHNAENMASLARFYDLTKRIVLSEHGYEMDVCEMNLKAQPSTR